MKHSGCMIHVTKRILPLCLFTFFLLSCESDSYDKGEGKYSNTLAEMAELTVNTQKQGVSFVTDDGISYNLSTPYTAKWIETADTTYRTIIYYDKLDDGRAKTVSCGQVGTLSPIAHWRFKKQPQDPVGVESAWLAKSGKYINLGLLVKSGYVDDKEGGHVVALACDTVLANGDGTQTAYYRLLHEQGDTPEYYTNRRYLSILLPADNRPDTVSLSIVTYNGGFERSFALK